MTLAAVEKSSQRKGLPKIGDSPVLRWGVAPAVSAAAYFMLRRRK